jgi:ABC-type uncharacterized transport system permease subunit
VTNPFSERSKDRLAGLVIRSGGILVIVLVVGMMANIAWQTVPLFRGAEAGDLVAVGSGAALAVGSSPRGDQSWWLGSDGRVGFHGRGGSHRTELDIGHQPVIAADHELGGLISVLSPGGRVAVGRVLAAGGAVGSDVGWRTMVDVRTEYGDARGITAVRDNSDGVVAVLWRRDELLLARGAADDLEFRQRINEEPVAQVAVSEGATFMAVVGRSGGLSIYRLPELTVRPVEGLAAPVERARFLIGGRSLVVAGRDGGVDVVTQVPRVAVTNTGDSAVRLDGWTFPPGETAVVPDDQVAYRLAHLSSVRVRTADPVWRVIRSLPAMPGRPTAISASHRDRGFVVGDALGNVALYNATSGRRLLSDSWGGGPVTALALAPRGNGAVAAVGDRVMARGFTNPHPEISLRTLFGPVWYEGYATPRHVWQTSGGSEAFEPKFGIWPLLFGTLKATFYAMLISAPLALLAALYVSQLAPPWLQGVVKPAVELMAAVPSVVVGFLAALWLAPRLELWLFPAMVCCALLPLSVVVALLLWRAVPGRLRRRIPRGGELVIIMAGGAAVITAGILLAHPLEEWLFAGDFQRHLFSHWGLRFDQRNSMVVGVALGFAVIPVIFTIAEDACSGVPETLVQAARALGATRWQAAIRLVVPAASPGLFAAVMLGLGRAVGETMIVLMASGNTPILDGSPLNGMRTMAAAIAIEIPEAAVGGTLFRVLFLTGLLLFGLSLVFTSAADAVGRRLRRRYARF